MKMVLYSLISVLLACGAAQAGANKVTICHNPPGDTDNAQTITVSEKALKAHLRHGDTIGACPTGCQLDPAICDDGNLCTADDCLVDGACSHQTISCDDGSVCTLDLCEPDGGCLNPPNDGVACDDGNACTDGDLCTDAVCVGQDIDGCCLIDFDCDDGDLCTTDTCIDHDCTNAAVDCLIPGDLCHVGYCDPASGDCASAPVDCDDGNVCTDDYCDPGVTGCYSLPTSDPPQAVETSCDDAADNDCDGLVDLDDPDCDDGTPPVISNVQANDVLQRTATITWTTDEPATSQVKYMCLRDTTYYLFTPVDPTLTTSHSVSLSGLGLFCPVYYYAISADAAGDGAISAEHTFRTLR